jgi:ribosomal protein L16/L10AE
MVVHLMKRIKSNQHILNTKRKKQSQNVIVKNHKIIRRTGLKLANYTRDQLVSDFLLTAINYGKMTKQQMEAIRRILKRNFKNSKFEFKNYAFVVFTKKPLQMRMGSGKGSRISNINSPIRLGQVLLKIDYLKPNQIHILIKQLNSKINFSFRLQNLYSIR